MSACFYFECLDLILWSIIDFSSLHSQNILNVFIYKNKQWFLGIKCLINTVLINYFIATFQRNWNGSTFLPALLLCRFIRLLASPSSSRASRNLLANRMPNPTSALHPPHFQPLGAGSALERGPGAHPQAEMFPRAHAAVTA